ncbi:hypothetical protein DER45DRAFT_607400 [Fusarium avenaceum]|nr:hypothetical protein DER45DRAFT_607400 [Fusarium avenaceum]
MADRFVHHNDGDNGPDNPPMNPNNNNPMNPNNNNPLGNAPDNVDPPPYIEPLLTLEYIRKKERLSLIFKALERTTSAANPVTIAGWHKFLNATFSRWTTRSAAPKNPVLPLKKFTETHIQVGILKCDHPLSDAQLREGVREQKDERISPDYVTLDPGMTSHTIRREPLMNYDFHELPRVRYYSKALILACAGRAVQKWVASGTVHRPHLDFDDLPTGLKTCIFASALAQEDSRRVLAASTESLQNPVGRQDSPW